MNHDRGYHHGDLRAALLDGVAETIRERGIGFVSLREVARRANVSHGAPAHHFRNKAALLTAFAAQGYERLGQSVMEHIAAAPDGSGPRRLEAIGCGYVRFAVENPERFGIMFRHELLDANDPEFMARSDAAYTLLASTVDTCVAEGHVEPGDAERVVVAAWSLVHGLASLLIGGRLARRIPDTDTNRLAADVARLFVDSVMPRARARVPARIGRPRRAPP